MITFFVVMCLLYTQHLGNKDMYIQIDMRTNTLLFATVWRSLINQKIKAGMGHTETYRLSLAPCPWHCWSPDPPQVTLGHDSITCITQPEVALNTSHTNSQTPPPLDSGSIVCLSLVNLWVAMMLISLVLEDPGIAIVYYFTRMVFLTSLYCHYHHSLKVAIISAMGVSTAHWQQ